jgi:hypothetical protein
MRRESPAISRSAWSGGFYGVRAVFARYVDVKLTDRVSVRPGVLSRQVGEETVILDVASGVYFGLNPVGARIWHLLSHGMTPAELSAVMSQEYETELAELERDVLKLAEELSARELIHVADTSR